MTDTMYKEPIKLEGTGMFSSILLPLSQVAEVRAILDAHSVRYEVDPCYWTWNDNPPRTRIDINPNENKDRVQKLLDSVP